jgi:quinol monooxygenase YgiN
LEYKEFKMSQNSIGLVINGTMEIAPEDRERFAATVQLNVAQTVGKAGCIRYIFAVDVMACPKF